MNILKLTGEIELLSGLHIGGGDDTMKIGGIDNGVIKDINTDKPYIPGSSLKGKMRSLLEWGIGVVNLKRNKDNEYGQPLTSSHIWQKDKNNNFIKDKFVDPAFEDTKLLQKSQTLLKLFGDKDGEHGITRISVGDCYLTKEMREKDENDEIKFSEAKYENVINRQTGTAEHPRQTERVPAGVRFDFDIRVKILPGDDKDEFKKMIERGLELIESDYLGGSGSRGYGRVRFIKNWE